MPETLCLRSSAECARSRRINYDHAHPFRLGRKGAGVPAAFARFRDSALLIAVGLYIAVAIAEAVFIWHALPTLPDIGSFYGFAP